MEKVKHLVLRFWKLIAAAICFFIVEFVQVGGYYLLEYSPFGGDIGAEVIGAIAAALALVVLGGRAMLKLDWEKIGKSFKIGWWTLAVSGALMALSIFDVATSGELADNWLPMLLYTLVFCLGVGFLEECLVRGLVLEGLLAVFGSKKVGIVLCAILSSVLFGAMHIDFYSLDTSDHLQVVQAILKIAQTGIFGFCLAAAVVETGNIVGASLIHAFDDFMLLLPTMALLGDTELADYVSTDAAEAEATITLYVIMCLLYLPLLISGIRALRRADSPNLGAFVRNPQLALAGEAALEDGTLLAQAAQDPMAMPGQPPAAQPYAQVPAQPPAAQPYAEVPAQPPAAQPYAHAPAQPTAAQPYAQAPVQPTAAQPYAQAPAQPPATQPYAQPMPQAPSEGQRSIPGAPPRPAGL